MKSFIIAKVSVEGFHFWPAAPDSVLFLKANHRHIFTIEAKKYVEHEDRDIEFILLGRAIKEFLSPYGTLCDFKSMSCEMIATEIAIRFKLDSCTVWEDGENAGGVELCE